MRLKTRNLLIASALVAAAAPVAAQVGALDTTFDGDGRLAQNFEDHDQVWAVTVADDGTIFTFGDSQNGGSPNARSARLAAFTADGTLVNTWEYDQNLGCSVPESFFTATLADNGDLLAGGYAQTSCSTGQERDFWVLRLAQDGTVIDRFETGDFANVDFLYGLAIQTDGKVVGVGFSSTTSSSLSRDLAVARWNADGTIDETGFGTDGKVQVDFDSEYDGLRAVAVQPDGKIVAAGFVGIDDQFDVALLRLNDDGTPDTGFGVNGLVATDYLGFDDAAYDMVLQPDGRIVVAGIRGTGVDVTEFIVARYLPDGSLDTGFGTAGVAAVDFGGPSAVATGLVRQLDGKLVVVGFTDIGAGGEPTRDVAVARLLPNGSPDLGFNGTGQHAFDLGFGQEDRMNGISIAPDGDLVAAGFTRADSSGTTTEDVAISRLIGDVGRDTVIFLDGFESGDISLW
jgi:uncharacterized delta-60 repeat protein